MIKTNEKTTVELLLEFRRKMNEKTKKLTFGKDLTLSQLETLIFIGIDDKKTMESISKHLNITPPSTTSFIDKLQKQKLITRKPDKYDRRLTYIELTPKTKKELSKMKSEKEKIFNSLLSKLTETERKLLKELIIKLID